MNAFLDSSTRPGTPDSGASGRLRIMPKPRRQPMPLRIGLVNNMPDAALVATERQFARLVQGAAAAPIELELFHIPTIPRGAEAREILASRYRPVSQLAESRIDALIVTGNEPRAARLDGEPYWDDLTALVDWARNNTRTAFWSCLAAHAAVLHLDGIERHRMPQKKSGVLHSNVDTRLSPLMPPTLSVCHSRLNEVRKADLLGNGYEIVSEAGGGHVDIFVKQLRSRFVFLQGHPEYDVDSLMKEYRRDAGRYLTGQRDTYPEVPESYFDDETVLRMENFRTFAERQRDAKLFEDFPVASLRAGLEGRLAQSAAAVFQDWLLRAEASASVV